jgi:hypothetical protein
MCTVNFVLLIQKIKDHIVKSSLKSFKTAELTEKRRGLYKILPDIKLQAVPHILRVIDILQCSGFLFRFCDNKLSQLQTPIYYSKKFVVISVMSILLQALCVYGAQVSTISSLANPVAVPTP